MSLGEKDISFHRHHTGGLLCLPSHTLGLTHTNTVVMHEYTHSIHITQSEQSINIHEKHILWSQSNFLCLPSYLQLCLAGSNLESSQSRPDRSWWPSWKLCWPRQSLSHPDSLSPQWPRCISSSSSHRSSWSLTWPSNMSATCKNRSLHDIYTPASWNVSLPGCTERGCFCFCKIWFYMFKKLAWSLYSFLKHNFISKQDINVNYNKSWHLLCCLSSVLNSDWIPVRCHCSLQKV